MKHSLKPAFILALLMLMQLPALFAGGKTGEGEEGVKIRIQVKNLPNTWCRVAYQFGEQRYVMDSLLSDKKGWMDFESDTLLPQGVYQLFLPDTTFFEFLMGEDQEFVLKTENGALMEKLVATGSVDNEVSVDYARFITAKEKEAKIWQAIAKDKEADADSIALAKENLQRIDEGVKAFQNKLMSDHKGTMAATLIASMQQIEIPPAPAEMSDSAKKIYRFHYYRNHYFDQTDLSDPRLLRAGVYHSKIMFYMNSLTYQNPDSLWESARYLVEQSKHDQVTFSYTLSTLTNKYANSKIMGFDYVFARLAETYYFTGLADWLSEEQLKDMRKHARGILNTMPGDPAKDITMNNLYGEQVSLFSVDAPYTIVVFWSSSCGHCRKELPKVHKLYKEYQPEGVACYAVSTDLEREGWQEFIEEHEMGDWINVIDVEHYSNFRKDYNVYTTPIIYLLDKDKNITAKKISVETLDDILAHELNIEPKLKKEEEPEQD